MHITLFYSQIFSFVQLLMEARLEVKQSAGIKHKACITLPYYCLD